MKKPKIKMPDAPSKKRVSGQLVSPPPPPLNAGRYMMEGIRLASEEHRLATARSAAEPQLRGGSTGLVVDGVSTGKCTREAAARLLGAEPERDPLSWANKQLMFEAGYYNEDAWFANLKRTWPGVILREEEFPIEWTVGGLRGTGREDLILCGPGGASDPVSFVELKNISSLGTATDVLLKGKPKMDHLIQAGNYCLRVTDEDGNSIPSEIWYTNRNEIAVPSWGFITPLLPKDISDTTHHAYPYLGWSKGGPTRPPAVTKILPFIVGYRLHWVAEGGDKRLYFQPVDTANPGEWFTTIITASTIDAFYESVTGMLRDEELPPRPQVLELDGGKGGYSKCDYCEFAPICDEAGDDYQKWRAAIDRLREETLADADDSPP